MPRLTTVMGCIYPYLEYLCCLNVKIPEGLVAAIPEMEVLIEEIDAMYVENDFKPISRGEVQQRLTSWSAALLTSLPAFIQAQVRFLTR